MSQPSQSDALRHCSSVRPSIVSARPARPVWIIDQVVALSGMALSSLLRGPGWVRSSTRRTGWRRIDKVPRDQCELALPEPAQCCPAGPARPREDRPRRNVVAARAAAQVVDALVGEGEGEVGNGGGGHDGLLEVRAVQERGEGIWATGTTWPIRKTLSGSQARLISRSRCRAAAGHACAISAG